MILALLQARMRSSRRPGKVLMPLAGALLVLRQIERIRCAGRIDQLVLATSREPSDDIRWIVDTPDDYAFAAAVYDGLYSGNPAFSSADVRAFVATRPDLANFGGHRRI